MAEKWRHFRPRNVALDPEGGRFLSRRPTSDGSWHPNKGHEIPLKWQFNKTLNVQQIVKIHCPPFKKEFHP